MRESPTVSNKSSTSKIQGKDGRREKVPKEVLYSGLDGKVGEAWIIVRSPTSGEQAYKSRFHLELVDFDVEDDNEDGIFEPGEHVFIHRIQVKNTGEPPNVTLALHTDHFQEECLLP